jgi:pimeloyl-ACP methyl ester carboxylesterase
MPIALSFRLVAACLALVAYTAAAQEPQPRTLEADGAMLEYVEAGSGTPVVLVHGNISDRRVWEPYREAISDDRRFVAYTQRYFGTADWPDDGERYSRETHIADLVALLESLPDGPAHLVTWSYGGEIATYAALRRPDLVRSIVHFEPDVGRMAEGLPGADAAAREMFAPFAPAFAAVEEERLQDAALAFIEAVFRMPEGAAAEEPDTAVAMWRANARTIPFLLALEPPPALDCVDLGALRVPTLVVAGEHTQTRFAMIAEHLATCQGNALLLEMPGVGHEAPYSRPEVLAATIEAFLTLIERER